MEILNEIRELFAQTKKNSAIKMESLDESYPAWVLRYDDWYGVGIPLGNSIEISERFSNARLWAKILFIGEIEQGLLLLTSTLESLRYEFASVCAQFVNPGENGRERLKTINNPHEWWQRWRSLLGDSINNKMVYSVLGEMMVYEKLLKKGLKPNWSGPFSGIHDFELNHESFEVKSTIQRYGLTITISNHFQLQNIDSLLNLVFCRFEQSESGDSIAEVVERIVALGIERDLINKALDNMGFEIGRGARLEKYKLIEMRKYLVDQHFPSITADSFVDKRIPESILQIIYKVDLTGLKYENWL